MKGTKKGSQGRCGATVTTRQCESGEDDAKPNEKSSYSDRSNKVTNFKKMLYSGVGVHQTRGPLPGAYVTRRDKADELWQYCHSPVFCRLSIIALGKDDNERDARGD